MYIYKDTNGRWINRDGDFTHISIRMSSEIRKVNKIGANGMVHGTRMNKQYVDLLRPQFQTHKTNEKNEKKLSLYWFGYSITFRNRVAMRTWPLLLLLLASKELLNSAKVLLQPTLPPYPAHRHRISVNAPSSSQHHFWRLKSSIAVLFTFNSCIKHVVRRYFTMLTVCVLSHTATRIAYLFAVHCDPLRKLREEEAYAHTRPFFSFALYIA